MVAHLLSHNPHRQMRLAVEILDHIFSFLVSHQADLIAFSRDPVLYPIIERHLYFHTIVHFARGWLDSDCSFEPDSLSMRIYANPHIVKYVRILQIQVELDNLAAEDTIISKQLDDFAKTLLMFPSLECIMLTTSKSRIWYWPGVFRAALEDRLKLPSIKEVHFVGSQSYPFSLIGNCTNIEKLLLAGKFDLSSYDEDEDEDEDEDGEGDAGDSTPLQLKSLTLSHISHSLVDSIKLHINGLQTLKCAEASVTHLSKFLGVCSATLKKLDIDLTYSPYSSTYSFDSGKVDDNPFTKISPIPPNLQQLIIRAPVCVENDFDEYMCTPKTCESYLRAASDIITSFIPPPQHLVVDVNIHLFEIASNLANVDFSPLAILGSAAVSIPRIDLYVHTGILPSAVTFAQLLASLADFDDVMRAIEKDILFIHTEAIAPDYDYYVKDY